MIKTLIFDFDDTVCNTTQCLEEGLKHSYRKLSEFYPKVTYQAFIRANTNAFKELFYYDRIPVYRASILVWFRILKKLKIKEDEVLIYTMYKYLYRYMTKNIQLKQGFKELMKFTKKNDIKLGILSNGSFLEKMERYIKLKIYRYKIKLVTSDIIGTEKPDPRSFRKILKMLKAKPSQTIFVGDTPSTDIIGAKRVGITPILMKRQSRSYTKQDEEVCDYFVTSHTEIINIIQSLNKTL